MTGIRTFTFVISLAAIGSGFSFEYPFAAQAEVTASQALAAAEKQCVLPKEANFVGWNVISSDGVHNVPDNKGAYWLVSGRYYPVTKPAILSVIDLQLIVPKDGSPVKGCYSLSN